MILATALTPGLNHLLQSAEWAQQRLRPFADQVFLIQLPPLTLAFKVTASGLLANCNQENPANVTITLPAATPFLMLQGSQQIFQQATVSGNAELAETLSFVFRNLSWDVEADLAPLVGDILAHRITRTGKAFKEWLSQSSQNLAANCVEYARDETGQLVGHNQLAHLSSAITTLRDDLARLEKRINRLEK